MNSLKEINFKNRTYYFFDDMNIKSFNLSKIKIDEKSYKIFLIITLYKLFSYLKHKRVNHCYLIIYIINRYIEEINGNK